MPPSRFAHWYVLAYFAFGFTPHLVDPHAALGSQHEEPKQRSSGFDGAILRELGQVRQIANELDEVSAS